MPPFEFAGDVSWGYNPAHLFAIESSYGGPDAFKAFIREAHGRGIAVIVDVVYNHLGPSDLDLWRFDGWARGRRRRDLLLQRRSRRDAVGRDAPRLRARRGPDVPARQRDDLARGVPLRRPALRFDRPHADRRGLSGPARFDSRCPTAGRSWPGSTTRSARPAAVEDHDRRGPRGRPDPRRRRPPTAARASQAQWDAGFIRRVRPQLVAHDDAAPGHRRGRRRASSARAAADRSAGSSTPSRTTRSPTAWSASPRRSRPAHAGSWWAKKRAVLGSALVLTSPGIPMLFQGQELLEDRWFDDAVSLDWEKTGHQPGHPAASIAT